MDFIAKERSTAPDLLAGIGCLSGNNLSAAQHIWAARNPEESGNESPFPKSSEDENSDSFLNKSTTTKSSRLSGVSTTREETDQKTVILSGEELQSSNLSCGSSISFPQTITDGKAKKDTSAQTRCRSWLMESTVCECDVQTPVILSGEELYISSLSCGSIENPQATAGGKVRKCSKSNRPTPLSSDENYSSPNLTDESTVVLSKTESTDEEKQKIKGHGVLELMDRLLTQYDWEGKRKTCSTENQNLVKQLKVHIADVTGLQKLSDVCELKFKNLIDKCQVMKPSRLRIPSYGGRKITKKIARRKTQNRSLLKKSFLPAFKQKAFTIKPSKMENRIPCCDKKLIELKHLNTNLWTSYSSGLAQLQSEVADLRSLVTSRVDKRLNGGDKHQEMNIDETRYREQIPQSDPETKNQPWRPW